MERIINLSSSVYRQVLGLIRIRCFKYCQQLLFFATVKHVRDLLKEAIALSTITSWISSPTRPSTLAPWFSLRSAFPSQRCGKACEESEQELKDCLSWSVAIARSFRIGRNWGLLWKTWAVSGDFSLGTGWQSLLLLLVLTCYNSLSLLCVLEPRLTFLCPNDTDTISPS